MRCVDDCSSKEAAARWKEREPRTTTDEGTVRYGRYGRRQRNNVKVFVPYLAAGVAKVKVRESLDAAMRRGSSSRPPLSCVCSKPEPRVAAASRLACQAGVNRIIIQEAEMNEGVCRQSHVN